MIQTYNDIEMNISQFNLRAGERIQIQKIYSSARYISFALREPGKTYYMFWGRGKGYEGLWFGERQIESALRKIDQFLEYLRKYLVSTQLLSLGIDEDDRILILKYQKYGKENILEIFYSGRRTYFLHYYYDYKKECFIVFTSWSKKRERTEVKHLEDFFDEVGRAKQSKTTHSSPRIIETLLKNEKGEGLKSVTHKKERKFLERKKKNILKDLEVIKDSKQIMDFINNNNELSIFDKKIFIGKIAIKFKNSDHYKRRDELYLKIKKLNKAKEILDLRLRDTLSRLEGKEDRALETSILDVIRIGIKEEKIEKSIIQTHGYEVIQIDNIQIGYGLTAQGNDQLRKEWASKNDFWFHIADLQSSHIVVKLQSLPSFEILSKVGKLMVELSGVKSSEVNLVYTQVKNLKGVTGKPGSVTFKKEKYIRIYV